MKRLFFLFIILSFSCSLLAQRNLDEINQTRSNHTFRGMLAFSGWTGANLIASPIGMATTTGEVHHFFEMNLYFNAINLAIAIPGLIGAVKDRKNLVGLSFEKTVKEVQKFKTMFLVNGVLDLTYITAGFLLREIGHNNRQNPALRNRLAGYGDSFIVQGAWLLCFDFVEFILHSANGKHLEEHWKKISIRPYGAYGLGLSLSYNFS